MSTSRAMLLKAAMARTLLPTLSSGGEKATIPICPGTAPMIEPETELFAGTPTS